MDFLARELLELGDRVKGNLRDGIDGHTVEIRSVPEDVMAVVLQQGDGLADVWLEAVNTKGLDGEGVMAHYRDAQQRYEAELEANGYPWD